MPVKKNDFVEIEYTGRLKDGNIVFDTTHEKIAQENDLPKGRYGPVVVILGHGQLVRGLENELIGREPGNYTIGLSAEQAFGKKDAKLIRMMPAKRFIENKIQPVPGLQLEIDGMRCTIRQVTGGRAMVDFNHPLAGKDVVYEIRISRVVSDRKEQLKAVLAMLLGISDAEISIEGSKASVALKQKLPEPIIPELRKKIKELVGIDAEIRLSEKETPAKLAAKNSRSEQPNAAAQQ